MSNRYMAQRAKGRLIEWVIFAIMVILILLAVAPRFLGFIERSFAL